jgi:N-acetylmuramic acid 6-phosphate (MurNAc-6-P) etherase
VLSNLMVDVKPTNVKLRDRAVRIVQTLTGADDARARRALEQTGWVIEDADKKIGQAGSKMRKNIKFQTSGL